MEEQEHKVEKNPHVYKAGYDKAEAEELIGWFEERMDRLPKTLKLNAAITTSNLSRTVKALLAVVRSREDMLDVTFSSYVSHLVLIRLRLMEQGME